MLTEFRAQVVQLLNDAFAAGSGLPDSPLDVYGRVPDDVNMLPCIVVGYPTAFPANESHVFDREVVVYVVARRPEAGDAEGELVELADLVWGYLGGTRQTKAGATYMQVDGLEHRVVQIAGLDHDAYLLTITSPISTC